VANPEIANVLQMVAPLGIAIVLAGYFVFNLRRERIFGYPPYDRYAEPIRYLLTQGTILSLAIGFFVGFVENVTKYVGISI
jgi:hypothetical protein